MWPVSMDAKIPEGYNAASKVHKYYQPYQSYLRIYLLLVVLLPQREREKSESQHNLVTDA